jgi:archaeal type IV pilus assembly protein PilA
MNNNQITARKRGIAPIIATLLLILIAIAAAVIVYAYVIGFIGSSTGNNGGTQNTISVDQAVFSSKTSAFPVTVYVRNQGPSAESFNTGFFLKASALNDQLAPAISVSVATGTLSIAASSNVSLVYASATSITVSIAGLSCTTATTATVAGFGVTGSATCSTSPTTQTATLTALGATVSSNFAASILTSVSAVSSVVVGTPVTAGTLSIAVNSVFEFTLALAGAQTTNPLSSGNSYTIQATGTDGATVPYSGKAA